jgi:hypothetical protein
VTSAVCGLYIFLSSAHVVPWLLTGITLFFLVTALGGTFIAPARRKLKDRRQQAIRTRAAATLFDWDDLGPTERTRIKLHNGLLTLNDARERVAEIKASEYGTPVVTPLQKSAPLPLCTVPPVTAGGPGPDWLTKPPEYVPDGQAELSASLLEYMRGQVKDAAPAREGHSIPYPGAWQMNEEWRVEVEKLRKADGRLLWPPGLYTVLGYCVELDDAFGAPNLVAS